METELYASLFQEIHWLKYVNIMSAKLTSIVKRQTNSTGKVKIKKIPYRSDLKNSN
mgnify:CR=1